METLQFVSHELNSPLSSIMNYAYMLRQRLLGAADRQAGRTPWRSITANLKRVMEMIRHYLNLARIESGEIQPVPTRVAVREEVIAPILASLQAEIHAKNLRVEDLIGPKVILQTDLNMTREVFENLLSNAVKYGRAGGLITLNCRAERASGRSSAVRNEGEGIPPERRGELFQKFSRIELGESEEGPARHGPGAVHLQEDRRGARRHDHRGFGGGPLDRVPMHAAAGARPRQPSSRRWTRPGRTSGRRRTRVDVIDEDVWHGRYS